MRAQTMTQQEAIYRLYTAAFNLGLDWYAKTPDQIKRRDAYKAEADALVRQMMKKACHEEDEGQGR